MKCEAEEHCQTLREKLQQTEKDNAKLADELKCAFNKHAVDDNVKEEQVNEIVLLKDFVKSLEKKSRALELTISTQSAIQVCCICDARYLSLWLLYTKKQVLACHELVCAG